MAVNINSVYQKVLALSNKEQRGYITPQEFNLLADMAQNDIYENYFHQARNSNAKIKDDDQYTDTLEMIEAKLAPFYKEETNTNTSGSQMTLPVDLYKLIDIKKSLSSNPITQINRSEHLLISRNSKSAIYPHMNATVYYRNSANTVFFLPSISNSTSMQVLYYKKPTTPSWAYVVVNEKALYNSNASVDFELASSEEEHLVSRILLLAGGAIKQPDAQQAGGAAIQMTNQEQNS